MGGQTQNVDNAREYKQNLQDKQNYTKFHYNFNRVSVYSFQKRLEVVKAI